MRLIRADARALPLKDGCVQMVCTSPPYWGLRSYPDARQIGVEPTPDAYVAELVKVFADVWRVLRKDGTAWVVLGDSYHNTPRGNAPGDTESSTLTNPMRQDTIVRPQARPSTRKGRSNGDQQRSIAWRVDGLKQKDLVGIPWRVAFALRAAGWYLRADVIWSKPNPMPESVTDRPTRSHEYLFLLSKSAKYYYHADAIREPYAESTLKEAETGYTGTARKEYQAAGVQDPSETKRRVAESIRRRVGMVEEYAGKYRSADPQSASRRMLFNLKSARESGAGHANPFGKGANKRSVWTIPTMPYAGAHFATFPEALVEPCILAGCPIGGLVLDPFIGSGTVGAVAERLGRRWVGIDLSYQELAEARTAQRGLRW